MAESAKHTALVALIARWVSEKHATVINSLWILQDTPDTDRGGRPWPIQGFVPDVFAGTLPRSFTLLGEAKCAPDFHTKRTERQLTAFIAFLATEPDPQLVFATSRSLQPAAKRLVGRIQRQVGAEHLQVTYLVT